MAKEFEVEVTIKFCTSFAGKDREKMELKLADLSNNGTATIEELNEVVPGLEHRNLKVKGWKRAGDDKLQLNLES